MAEKLVAELNENKLQQVDRLLRHGANPNEVLREQSVSPMHIAAGLGIKPVCLLLQHGGDPNVRLPDGTTPLHVASMWGDADCVQILLSNGGDPYIRDQDGLSAMDFAKQFKHWEALEAIKKYMFLLTAAEEVTMTPKYTYTRRSLESNTMGDSPEVTNGDVDENLNLDQYLKEFTRRRRRSSVYLNCVQRQIDKYFSEGQKTHIVDVTSPDHLYIEPRHDEPNTTPTRRAKVKSPDLEQSQEESLCLHLSSSDSEESTNTTSSTSFVTCDGEDLDTVIKMGSLHLTAKEETKPTPKTVQNNIEGLTTQSLMKAAGRKKKYCRRLPVIPSDTQDLFSDQNVCEFCGCEVKGGTSAKEMVCLSCEKLGLELEELSLKTDMAGDCGISSKSGQTGSNSVTNRNNYFIDDIHRDNMTYGYQNKESIQNKSIQSSQSEEVNRGRCRNQNYIKQKDNLLDLNQCFIQSMVSDDSIISQDESFICQKIQKAEFHPSDISTITISESCNDHAFIQSDSRYKAGEHKETIQSKETDFKSSGERLKNYKKDKYPFSIEGSTFGYDSQDNAFIVSDFGGESYNTTPKSKDLLTVDYRPKLKHSTDDVHDLADSGQTTLSPKVMDDLWSEVRASAMKAKRVRDTRHMLDTAFIGRDSMTSGVSDTSTVDYVYTDTEHGIVLLERHLPSVCGSAGSRRSLDSLFTVDISPKEAKKPHHTSASSDDTVEYDWKEHALIGNSADSENGESVPNTQPLSEELLRLNDEQVRSKLSKYWDDPGPINSATRQLYLRRLSSLPRDPTAEWLTKKGPEYPPELKLALNGKLDLTDCSEVESKMVEAFQNPNRLRRWREGTLKSSFNYLLLDPRITDNLPNRAANMDDLDIFRTFISAIFYVGKGKRARPYSHLYEAIKQMKKPKDKVSKKVQAILDIWSGDMGVVSLHCFQSVIPVEAYTREACMVDAIGLTNLTNMKRGDYYGVSTTYSMKQRRRVGVYLLTKALKIFLAEGERQISPLDIKNDP